MEMTFVLVGPVELEFYLGEYPPIRLGGMVELSLVICPADFRVNLQITQQTPYPFWSEIDRGIQVSDGIRCFHHTYFGTSYSCLLNKITQYLNTGYLICTSYQLDSADGMEESSFLLLLEVQRSRDLSRQAWRDPYIPYPREEMSTMTAEDPTQTLEDEFFGRSRR